MIHTVIYGNTSFLWCTKQFSNDTLFHACIYIYYIGMQTKHTIFSYFLMPPARSNHESGDDESAKKKRKANKGDCISIAKKIALIDEFNALKDRGCMKPNNEPQRCVRKSICSVCLCFWSFWQFLFWDRFKLDVHPAFLSTVSLWKGSQNTGQDIYLYVYVINMYIEHLDTNTQTQEMLKRKRPGYYSGCCSATKWPAARAKYHWDKFAQMLPAQASKRDEVPSWLKTRLCEDSTLFKGPKKEAIPSELLQIADAVLMDEMSRGLEMCKESVTQTLIGLIDIYNEEAETYNSSTQKAHIDKACELEQSGTLSATELEDFVKSPPKQIATISKDWTARKLEYVAARFCRTWGYSLYRQDRPSKHLSREHPSMKSLEEYIQCLKKEKKIGQLMFNWDQVWTCILTLVGFIV